MKRLATILTILTILSFSSLLYSQTLNIHKNDGTVHNYTLSEIDSITYNNVISASWTPCPGTPTVSYAGKTYNTVLIGDQCWLKENLDVGTMIESRYGEWALYLQTDNDIIEKYCYDNDPANCIKYGGLYERDEALKYIFDEGTQGICPNGWHIPTYSEFETLQNYVNNKGSALMDQSDSLLFIPAAVQNETGFSALLGGGRDAAWGYFVAENETANFWHTGPAGYFGGWMTLRTAWDDIELNGGSTNTGHSIRCIKD